MLLPNILKTRTYISYPLLGNKPPTNLVASSKNYLCSQRVPGQEYRGNVAGGCWLRVPDQVAAKLSARAAVSSRLDWGQNPLVGSCLWLVAVPRWLLA